MRNFLFGLIMAILATLVTISAAPVAAAPLACNKVFAVAEKSAEALIVAKTPLAKAHLSARLGRIWKREGARCALPPVKAFIEGVNLADSNRLLEEANREMDLHEENIKRLADLAHKEREEAAKNAEKASEIAKVILEEDAKAKAEVAKAKAQAEKERMVGLERECYSPASCVAEIEHLAQQLKRTHPNDRLPVLKAYLAAMAKLEVMLK